MRTAQQRNIEHLVLWPTVATRAVLKERRQRTPANHIMMRAGRVIGGKRLGEALDIAAEQRQPGRQEPDADEIEDEAGRQDSAGDLPGSHARKEQPVAVAHRAGGGYSPLDPRVEER